MVGAGDRVTFPEEDADMTMTLKITNIGNVRGSCGHKHTTLTGAARCLRSDVIACHRQGGYSDRIPRKSDGERLDWETQGTVEQIARTRKGI